MFPVSKTALLGFAAGVAKAAAEAAIEAALGHALDAAAGPLVDHYGPVLGLLGLPKTADGLKALVLADLSHLEGHSA